MDYNLSSNFYRYTNLVRSESESRRPAPARVLVEVVARVRWQIQQCGHQLSWGRCSEDNDISTPERCVQRTMTSALLRDVFRRQWNQLSWMKCSEDNDISSPEGGVRGQWNQLSWGKCSEDNDISSPEGGVQMTMTQHSWGRWTEDSNM